MSDKSFAVRLVSDGILSSEELSRLMTKLGDSGEKLRDHLLETGAIPRNDLGKRWGDAISVAYVDLEKTLFQKEALSYLSYENAVKYNAIPLYLLGSTITVATDRPADQDRIQALRMVSGKLVSPVFSFPGEISDAISINYQSTDSIEGVLNRIFDNPAFQSSSQQSAKITHEQIAKLAGDKAMIELANGIILLAVKERASDIHIEPREDMVHIRFRIDGVLHERLRVEHALLSAIISRYKVMANLDITERRRPQDGRLSLKLASKSVDIRMSTVPAVYGEKIVMRILGQVMARDVPELEDLLFSKPTLEAVKRIIHSPNGVFFVTGPTGSGKTTTLFSILKRLNKPDINIMTIEDPVEYRLAGINQIQVNHEIDLNFATALRAFLRQDPDVILIGEIRDLETAKIASQAALTGHLVLATLHTNNALQAVTRLIEIGVEPFLVAPSIIGVMAQRLVRKICDKCREPYVLDRETAEQYFILKDGMEVTFYRGKGCPSCNNTGYSGRIAVHEIFLITEEVRAMVASGVSILDIQKKARDIGFKDLRYDGMKKVLRGLTTITELERISSSGNI